MTTFYRLRAWWGKDKASMLDDNLLFSEVCVIPGFTADHIPILLETGAVCISAESGPIIIERKED